jgi:predicted 3-demethylubiquinone-9 3-methyltransferase (glyoxalase superfamily)
MMVDFILDGNKFMGLNGGPVFTHSPAVSFVIPCKDQKEVDHYWDALSAVPEAEQCGWVCDKFGISWQIVPNALRELIVKDPSGKVMKAMMNMKKINIADLEKAYNS